MEKVSDKKRDPAVDIRNEPGGDLRKRPQGTRDDKRDDVVPETTNLDQNQGKLDTPDIDKRPEGQATRN